MRRGPVLSWDRNAVNPELQKGYNKMTKAQGSEVVVVKQSTDLAAIDELEQALLNGTPPAELERDPEEVSKEILAQLLGATDDEQLERLEAEGWSTFSRDQKTTTPEDGHPFEIHSFVWRPSAFDEGHVVFLVVRATSLVDGSPHVLTTGAGQAMAQLVNLAKRGTLVGAVRQMVGTSTNNQRDVYWLETPPAIAEARRAAAREQRAEAAAIAAGDDTSVGDDTSAA